MVTGSLLVTINAVKCSKRQASTHDNRFSCLISILTVYYMFFSLKTIMGIIHTTRGY